MIFKRLSSKNNGPMSLWKLPISTNYKELKLGSYLPPNLLPNFHFTAPKAMIDFGKDVQSEVPAMQDFNRANGSKKVEIKGLEKHVLLVDRVVRVNKGGKQSTFRVVAVVGNRKGLVGLGIGKAKSPRDAIPKAVEDAQNNLVSVPLYQNRTLFHDATIKFKATILELRIAPPGFGLRCNHAIHSICQCAGIVDIGAKLHGSTNVMNVCKAMIQALKSQRSIKDISIQRGINIVDLKSKYYGE
eukprot:NODE_163_length_16507_cov_1.031814.p7 type:complete len:243 gc:universal NODE_163_length_16507_cov_1.031814:5307-6035(+)